MEYKDSTFTLNTGKTFHANNGLLGIGVRREGVDVVGGSDDSVELPWNDDFTKEERLEIATHTIKLWVKWAAK